MSTCTFASLSSPPSMRCNTPLVTPPFIVPESNNTATSPYNHALSTPALVDIDRLTQLNPLFMLMRDLSGSTPPAVSPAIPLAPWFGDYIAALNQFLSLSSVVP